MNIPPRARHLLKKLDPFFRDGKTLYCSDHLVEFANTGSLLSHLLSTHVDADPSFSGLQRNVVHFRDTARFLRIGPMEEGERDRKAGKTAGDKYP
jgi:hypothetical protein